MSTEARSIGVGDIVAGKLRVVRLIGKGGMGAVYEVEHLVTRHRRALKLLRPEYLESPAAVERLWREASAAGRTGSPHIVETLDAERLPSGEPYLVMELLQGEPLSGALEREGRLGLAFVADVLAQAADGVQAAHEAGIIHRDLKTDNLFLVETRSGRPFVKVIDFGISKFDPARTRDLGLTAEGVQMGTPYYMSPEQMLCRPLDERTDVYSLGVVLYECVTGQKPFHGRTLVELTASIIQGHFPPVHELRAEVGDQLESLIATAMATDREQRFRGAAALAAALRHLYPSEPWTQSSSPPHYSGLPSV